MKKSIIGSATSVIILLASPYLSSFYMSLQYQKMIDHFNSNLEKNPDLNRMVEVTGTFSKGYFSSKATTTFKNNSSNVHIKHFIQNGPIIFKPNSMGFDKLGLARVISYVTNQDIEKLEAEVFKDKNKKILSADTTFNFFDSATTDVDMPAFSFSDESGTKVLWDGAVGKFKHNHYFSEGEFDLKTNRFLVEIQRKGKRESFEFGKMYSYVKSYLKSDDKAKGKFELDKLAVVERNTPVISIVNYKVDFEYDGDNSAAHSAMRVVVDEFYEGAADVAVKNISFDISLDNFSTKNSNRIKEIVETVKNNPVCDISYIKEITEMDLHMSMKGQAEFPKGNASFSMSARTDVSKALDKYSQNPEGKDMIFGYAMLDLEYSASKMLVRDYMAMELQKKQSRKGRLMHRGVEMPQPMSPGKQHEIDKQVDELINSFVMQGFIVDDGVNYSSSIVFKEGALIMNGVRIR